ncbi:MAG: thiamine-binding protein [Egibacteraceae bacterium]
MAAAYPVGDRDDPHVLVWFSVTPVGTGSGSVSREVAWALDAVDATGVPYTTDASGTLLEGRWSDCMRALKVAGLAMLEAAPRVSYTCKIDLRGDKPGRTGAEKLASLDAKRHGDAAT